MTRPTIATQRVYAKLRLESRKLQTHVYQSTKMTDKVNFLQFALVYSNISSGSILSIEELTRKLQALVASH